MPDFSNLSLLWEFAVWKSFCSFKFNAWTLGGVDDIEIHLKIWKPSAISRWFLSFLKSYCHCNSVSFSLLLFSRVCLFCGCLPIARPLGLLPKNYFMEQALNFKSLKGVKFNFSKFLGCKMKMFKIFFGTKWFFRTLEINYIFFKKIFRKDKLEIFNISLRTNIIF